MWDVLYSVYNEACFKHGKHTGCSEGCNSQSWPNQTFFFFFLEWKDHSSDHLRHDWHNKVMFFVFFKEILVYKCISPQWLHSVGSCSSITLCNQFCKKQRNSSFITSEGSSETRDPQFNSQLHSPSSFLNHNVYVFCCWADSLWIFLPLGRLRSFKRDHEGVLHSTFWKHIHTFRLTRQKIQHHSNKFQNQEHQRTVK